MSQLHDEPGVHETRDGGDPACWLSHVCPECGALVEGSTAVSCWRCGAAWDPDA